MRPRSRPMQPRSYAALLLWAPIVVYLLGSMTWVRVSRTARQAATRALALMTGAALMMGLQAVVLPHGARSAWVLALTLLGIALAGAGARMIVAGLQPLPVLRAVAPRPNQNTSSAVPRTAHEVSAVMSRWQKAYLHTLLALTALSAVLSVSLLVFAVSNGRVGTAGLAIMVLGLVTGRVKNKRVGFIAALGGDSVELDLFYRRTKLPFDEIALVAQGSLPSVYGVCGVLIERRRRLGGVETFIVPSGDDDWPLAELLSRGFVEMKVDDDWPIARRRRSSPAS